MPAVELLDRYDCHEAASASLVRPNAFDLRNAGRLELIPDGPRAICAEIIGVVVRRYRRYGAEQDGIVSVHDTREANGRCWMAADRRISGPLAERTFLQHVVGVNIAFKGDFRIGWYGDARLWQSDDI